MKNQKLDLNNSILSRKLDIHDENDKIISHVTIFIGKPEQINEETWTCPYSIVGLDDVDESTYRANGVDSIQALQCAFVVIEGLLSSADLAKKGRLSKIENSASGFLN